MGKEKNFENQIKRYLKSEGVVPFGTPTNQLDNVCGYYEKRFGTAFTKSGLPDLHIVINSISIECEVKAEEGILSELQRHNLKQLTTTGNIAFELRPAGFDDFKKLVQYLKSTEVRGQMDIIFNNANKFFKK